MHAMRSNGKASQSFAKLRKASQSFAKQRASNDHLKNGRRIILAVSSMVIQ